MIPLIDLICVIKKILETKIWAADGREVFCSPNGACGVPIHYFHLFEGERIVRDTDGRDVAGQAAIATMALAEARSLVSADALTGRIDLRQSIEVKDARGRVVHRLRFSDAVEILA